MRAVLWGGPDDGLEIEVPDKLSVIEQVIGMGEDEFVMAWQVQEGDFGDRPVRRYRRVRLIRSGAAIFKIDRNAP